MAETVKNEQKENVTLMPGRFQLAEQVRNVYCATAESGVTFKQMMQPDYWAHEARKLKPYDMIECRSDDGVFWGLAIVLESARNWAKLHPLQYVPLTTKDMAQTASEDMEKKYRIEYKGPTLKHVVIRNSDNEIVHQGEDRKVAAQAWLADHIKTIA